MIKNEKSEARYLLAKGYSKQEVIKKLRKESNFALNIKDTSELVNECLPVLKRVGKLMGCAGAEGGQCSGYPRCFEVGTCITCS